MDPLETIFQTPLHPNTNTTPLPLHFFLFCLVLNLFKSIFKFLKQYNYNISLENSHMDKIYTNDIINQRNSPLTSFSSSGLDIIYSIVYMENSRMFGTVEGIFKRSLWTTI